MHSESPLPCYKTQSGSSKAMLSVTMGKLQRQLYKGEYDIFKYAHIFESDFIQITRKGKVIDVHNHLCLVTVGIVSTSPNLLLPDVMLLARPAPGYDEDTEHSKVTKEGNRKAAKTLELTRLLPLKFVQMSIHDGGKQQLRLKFAKGRSCYLQLCPPPDAQKDLFTYWEKLIYLLQKPMDSYSRAYTSLARNMISLPVLEEEESGDLEEEANFQGKEDEDKVSVRSLHMVTEVAGATSAGFAGGEEIQYDSGRVTVIPDAATPDTEPGELDRAPAAGPAAGVAAGTPACALRMATTKSDVPEQPSTASAGAATKDLGGSETSIAIVGAADMSPKSTKMAWVAAANKSAGGPSTTSPSTEAAVIATTARAEPASKTVGEAANDCATGPPVSTLPSEDCVSEQSRRQQRVPAARAKAHKSRRDEREQREREAALRSPHHRRATESQHEPGSDEILRKPPGWSLARQRDDQKETGCSSPGSSRPGHAGDGTGISHAPITKILSRISNFLRKINLTTKTAASTQSKDVDNLMEKMENSMEGVTERGESGQGPEVVDSATLEITETFGRRTENCKGDLGSREIPREPISTFLTAV